MYVRYDDSTGLPSFDYYGIDRPILAISSMLRSIGCSSLLGRAIYNAGHYINGRLASEWGTFPSAEVLPIEGMMRAYDDSSKRWLDATQPIGEHLMCGSIIYIVPMANVVSRDLSPRPEPHQSWHPPRQEDEWDTRFDDEWTAIRSTDVSFEGQFSSSSGGPRERNPDRDDDEP